MWLLGWRYPDHVLFLPQEVQGTLEQERNKRQGKLRALSENADYKRSIKGSKILTPRGETGEGRVRIWGCDQHFRFSFVHVFNGYVASLSIDN